jgi:hypothetical protein
MKKRPHNSTFAIGGVSCYADSFVVAESFVLRINISGKNPAHRKSANRYARRCLPFSPILQMGHFYSGWQLTTATQHGYSGWLKDGYSERLVKKNGYSTRLLRTACWMATQQRLLTTANSYGNSSRLVGWQLRTAS